MQGLVQKIEAKYKKRQVVDVRTGDNVRVHQKIKEGNKERVQIFEGMVIRTDRKKSLTSTITVRRISSGIGVEKSYMLHSPNVLKVEITKRGKVRRKYLTYIRKRTGKSTRLTGMDFDKHDVNKIHDEEAEAAEEKLREEALVEHEAAEAEAKKAEAEVEKKVEEALKSHDQTTQDTKQEK